VRLDFIGAAPRGSTPMRSNRKFLACWYYSSSWTMVPRVRCYFRFGSKADMLRALTSGSLLIEWSRGATQLVIRWCETGGPPARPPSRQGFGTRVVGRVVHDLKGKLGHRPMSVLSCRRIILPRLPPVE